MPLEVIAEPQKAQKAMTPANVVTIVRICLVPVFLAALLSNWPDWLGLEDVTQSAQGLVAAVIFILISCTDWLDGYLARSRNEVTDFGKFMDPLADKILVAAALIALVELGALPTWAVVIILAREFIVSGIRMMAAAKGEVIAASYIGKFKTVFQMIAIVLFTVRDSQLVTGISPVIADNIGWFSWAVMLVALALTLVSMLDYLVKARDVIGLGRKRKGAGAAEEVVLVTEGVEALAASVVARAVERGVTIATAESLTGGLAGATITRVAGASAVFKGGVMSYVNEVKAQVLGVDGDVLMSEGAVCERVAIEMAQGARNAIGTDMAVSMTGIAGPTGEEPGKPVGTVYIGYADGSGASAQRFEFAGTRDDVREQSVEQALKICLEHLG